MEQNGDDEICGDDEIYGDDKTPVCPFCHGNVLFRGCSDRLQWWLCCVCGDEFNTEIVDFNSQDYEESNMFVSTRSEGNQDAAETRPKYDGPAKYDLLEIFNDRSVEACNRAIRIDPNDADAWNNKGVALKKQAKYDEAIEAYDEAVRIDPKFAIAWNNKGLVLYYQSKYDEAIKAYDEAIRIDPKLTMAWYNKCVALKQLGKYDEAIRAYDEATRLDFKDATNLEAPDTTLEGNEGFANFKGLEDDSFERLSKVGESRGLKIPNSALNTSDHASKTFIDRSNEMLSKRPRRIDVPQEHTKRITTKGLEIVIYNAMRHFESDLHNKAVRIFAPLPDRAPLHSVDIPSEMKLFLEKYEPKLVKDGLFLHQAEFIRAYLVEGHKNFIITTGTGSGKSLCFWFWVFHHLREDDQSTALLCFPTQALIMSQADRLDHLSDKDSRIKYDDAGTTYAGTIKLGNQNIPWTLWYGTDKDPIMRRHQMSETFSKARIRISTLDKLHWSLMGSDKRFLANLTCMVLDEAHMYHGVFGANAHYFLKRLYMSCDILGKEKPSIFLASATLAEPERFAKNLLSLSDADEIRHIKDSTLQEIELIPISEVPNQLTQQLNGLIRLVLLVKSPKGTPLAQFMKSDDNLGLDINAIYFSKNKSQSRKIKRSLKKSIRSAEVYDADMTAKQRRETERKLNDENTKGVTVLGTSALELGIDIKGLDLCLLEDIPLGRAEMFQRIGRVGRQLDLPGLVIMRVTDSPNDQNILDNPRAEFQPALTRAMPIPTHLEKIKWRHALAASKEWWEPMLQGNCDIMALSGAFRKYFDEDLQNPQELESRFKDRYGDLVDTSGDYWIYEDFRPSAADGVVPLKMGNLDIGNINVVDIFRDAHPGAVYFDYNAKRYRVIGYKYGNKKGITKKTDLRSVKEIQVINENRAISTKSSWVGSFDLNREVKLSAHSDCPRNRSIRYGIWSSTRTWQGYTEYEEVGLEDRKPESKDKEKIKTSRYVARSQIVKEISIEFPDTYSFRTMGWEWKFGPLQMENEFKPQDLICCILEHFIANAVESEPRDLEIKLDLYNQTLRVTDKNPGGNGLSEALLVDQRMISALKDCERKIAEYLEIEKRGEFEKYIRNLCQQKPDCSTWDVLEVIYKLHEKWAGSNSIFINRYGEYQYRSRNFDKSITYFEEAIEKDPRCFSAWTNKGKALAQLGKYNESLVCFNKGIEINPQNAAAWNGKGTVLYQHGKNDDAIEAYEEAIRLDSKFALPWYNKGIALDAQGNYTDAIKSYDKAIRLNPKLDQSWNNKGKALFSIGKYDAAIKAFEEAIRLDHNDAMAWYNKGVALGKQDKYDDAIKAYDEAIRLNPNYAEALHNKGIALNILKLKS